MVVLKYIRRVLGIETEDERNSREFLEYAKRTFSHLPKEEGPHERYTGRVWGDRDEGSEGAGIPEDDSPER